MPVYMILEEMPYEEMLKWIDYFDRRPVEWRDDLRAAKIMQSFGVKAKPQELFESLEKIHQRSQASSGNSDGSLDVNSLKRSAFFMQMLGASGGDKPEFLNDKG